MRIQKEFEGEPIQIPISKDFCFTNQGIELFNLKYKDDESLLSEKSV